MGGCLSCLSLFLALDLRNTAGGVAVDFWVRKSICVRVKLHTCTIKTKAFSPSFSLRACSCSGSWEARAYPSMHWAEKHSGLARLLFCSNPQLAVSVVTNSLTRMLSGIVLTKRDIVCWNPLQTPRQSTQPSLNFLWISKTILCIREGCDWPVASLQHTPKKKNRIGSIF